MAERTVAEKARIKPGTTIAVLNPVRGLVGTLGLPADVRFVPSKKAQLVFLFVSTRAELEARMPAVVAGLAPNAALWVFFRKGSTTVGLDMDRDSVWAAAAELGMRPIGLLSIDDIWSAFRLRASGATPHRISRP